VRGKRKNCVESEEERRQEKRDNHEADVNGRGGTMGFLKL